MGAGESSGHVSALCVPFYALSTSLLVSDTSRWAGRSPRGRATRSRAAAGGPGGDEAAAGRRRCSDQAPFDPRSPRCRHGRRRRDRGMRMTEAALRGDGASRCCGCCRLDEAGGGRVAAEPQRASTCLATSWMAWPARAMAQRRPPARRPGQHRRPGHRWPAAASAAALPPPPQSGRTS
jgi:hypothetical protein